MKFLSTVLLVLLVSGGEAGSWVPPGKPDPHVILEEAREDSRSGRHEIALAKFVWYHENALRIEPALKGVRLSFALSYWHELAANYPPALVAMESARDKAAAEVLSGRRVRRSFQDLAAINRELGQETRTQQLFETLDREQPEAAKKVFDLAEAALIRGQALELANKYVNPSADFARIAGRYREDVRMVRDSSMPAEHLDFSKRYFTSRAATLVAILAVNGRHEEAASIAASSRKECDDPAFGQSLASALTGVVPEPWP